MILTYKYRYYPTDNQSIYINNTFSMIKKYWNRLLTEKNKYYKDTGKILIHKTKDLIISDPYIEREQYDLFGVQNSIMQLNDLFERNTKDNKPLKFKTDIDQKTFCINNYNNRIFIDNGIIYIKKIGTINAKYSRKIPDDAIIKKIIIIKTKTMKYFICVSFEIKKNSSIKPLNKQNSIGLDFSIANFYIDSNGGKGQPIISNYLETKYNEKIKKLKLILKRKEVGSSNYKKTYLKLLKVYEKIKNTKNDYLHKESSRLVNKYDVIATESLYLREMASQLNVNKETNNHFKLGKKVYDTSYARFLLYLKYKCELKNKIFVSIDTFFPSSQICNYCNYLNKQARLLNKKFIICPKCGRMYNRDINAAKNIKKEGLRIVENKNK